MKELTYDQATNIQMWVIISWLPFTALTVPLNMVNPYIATFLLDIHSKLSQSVVVDLDSAILTFLFSIFIPSFIYLALCFTVIARLEKRAEEALEQGRVT